MGSLRIVKFLRRPHFCRVVFCVFQKFVCIEEAIATSEALRLSPVLNDGNVCEIIGYAAVHNLAVLCNPLCFPIFKDCFV